MKKTTDYKFFYIQEQPISGNKTKLYCVINRRHEALLGRIKWYGPWRQYCFFPEEETDWNLGCLEGILDFLTKLKSERGSEKACQKT